MIAQDSLMRKDILTPGWLRVYFSCLGNLRPGGAIGTQKPGMNPSARAGLQSGSLARSVGRRVRPKGTHGVSIKTALM